MPGLTVSDLREIVKFLYPATGKWFRIGEKLQVDPEELESIAAIHEIIMKLL